MATQDPDAATIVVRLDMEGAKRDLASFMQAANRGAASAATSQQAGGGGGGGTRGGARASGGGGQGGIAARAAAGGVKAAGNAGRSMVGAMGLGGLARGGMIGMAAGIGADLMSGGIVHGATGFLTGGIAGATAHGRSLSQIAHRYSSAAAEIARSDFKGADARGGLRAMDETMSAFAYAVGAGGMDPKAARPFMETMAGIRAAEERGRLELQAVLGEDLMKEAFGEAWKDSPAYKTWLEAKEFFKPIVGFAKVAGKVISKVF